MAGVRGRRRVRLAAIECAPWWRVWVDRVISLLELAYELLSADTVSRSHSARAALASPSELSGVTVLCELYV